MAASIGIAEGGCKCIAHNLSENRHGALSVRHNGKAPKRGLLSFHEVLERLHRLDLQDPLGLDLGRPAGGTGVAGMGRAVCDLDRRDT